MATASLTEVKGREVSTVELKSIVGMDEKNFGDGGCK